MVVKKCSVILLRVLSGIERSVDGGASMSCAPLLPAAIMMVLVRCFGDRPGVCTIQTSKPAGRSCAVC